jgi:citrate lyase subunit beta-like protein
MRTQIQSRIKSTRKICFPSSIAQRWHSRTQSSQSFPLVGLSPLPFVLFMIGLNLILSAGRTRLPSRVLPAVRTASARCVVSHTVPTAQSASAPTAPDPVQDRPYRPRRSLMSVPGSDPRKIHKATTIGADSVVLDLEDGVAWDRKDEARSLVARTLLDPAVSFGPHSEVCVRINGTQTPHFEDDLREVLPCPRLQAIVVPKVESTDDLRAVQERVDALCGGSRDVRILAAIESALGVLNLRDIASYGASHGNLDGLIFASEDYCADVEAIRTADATELLYARSHLVTVAKAHGLQAIDMVHIQFRDLDGLAAECQRGRELGFTGKQAIHPSQIPHIHRHFSPSERDVAFAQEVVRQYQDTTSQGRGAVVVEGIVVDFPVYKWAVKVLRRAEMATVST